MQEHVCGVFNPIFDVMKSFYSILTVPIRPSSQEQLNIGLLMVNSSTLLFKFSAKKLDFIKKLVPENSFNLLKSYVFGLAEKLNSMDDTMRLKFGKIDFVSYLSNYNSNLVTFSKPTPIELDVTDYNFRTLFEKFIFTYGIAVSQDSETESATIKNQLKINLYPRIKDRVNLNHTITTKEVPTLLVPSIKVNFIGQNNIPVAGQGVDFEGTASAITNNVSKLINLIKAFEMGGKQGQYFVIGREPDKRIFSNQHDNWQHIRSSGLIEFVDMDELQRITAYIEQHDVKPFVAE